MPLVSSQCSFEHQVYASKAFAEGEIVEVAPSILLMESVPWLT